MVVGVTTGQFRRLVRDSMAVFSSCQGTMLSLWETEIQDLHSPIQKVSVNRVPNTARKDPIAEKLFSCTVAGNREAYNMYTFC